MACQLYRHFDGRGNLLYVGISLNAVARAGQHKTDSAWFYQSRTMTIENFDTRTEARDAEIEAIRSELPAFNCCGVANTSTKKPRPLIEIRKQERERQIAQQRKDIEEKIRKEIEYEDSEISQQFARARIRLRQLRDATDTLNGKIVTQEHVLWQLYQWNFEANRRSQKPRLGFVPKFLEWLKNMKQQSA